MPSGYSLDDHGNIGYFVGATGYGVTGALVSMIFAALTEAKRSRCPLTSILRCLPRGGDQVLYSAGAGFKLPWICCISAPVAWCVV